MGKDLFDRTSRSIRLTAAGKAFLQPARLMVHHADIALRAAGSGIEGGVETLRVGLMIGAAQPAVGRLIRRFKDMHPETLITFKKADESTLGRQLTTGEIDVAVAWDASIPSGLYRKRLAKAPMMFVLPTGHRLARKKAIRLSDAAQEPIILPARESQPIIYQTYCRMVRDAGFEPTVSIDVLTIDDLLAVVAAGAGIGNAPITPGLRYPGVVLRPNSPEYLLTYELAWVDDRPAVRDLLTLVKD